MTARLARLTALMVSLIIFGAALGVLVMATLHGIASADLPI
jgi:hypothetical protein